MRRTIETYIIYLKEDLKLADTLKTAKEKLLKSITDKTHFSEELAAYFVKQGSEPFAISSSDPSQVAVLKKILNSFDDAERALREVENLNIDPERGGILFNAAQWVGLSEAAKTAEIIGQAAQIYYKKIHEVYAALQLLNHANADIQNIVGPHLQALMPRLALAQTKLEAFTPSFPAESAGEFIADVVSHLPSQRQAEEHSVEGISQWVVSLPQYFDELQKIIAKSATSRPSQSAASAEEYQAAMLKKAKESKEYFDHLISSQEGLLSTTSTFINYFKIMSEIALQSSKVIQTAPVNQKAYLEVAKKLEVLKHSYLPQVIAELEKIEEGMGLKAGLLTAPAMIQMNKYYSQLASTVDDAAKTAGVLELSTPKKATDVAPIGGKISPKADLLVMEDEGFRQARRASQEARLSEARIEAGNTEMSAAAQRFFDRLNSYSYIYQTYCKFSLANISQEEKVALIADYKKFQSHFAAVKPEVDKLIVDALTVPTGSNLVSRILGAQYKQLWGANHFSEVLSCKDKVVESIEQSLAQAQFKAKLIEKSISHAKPSASLQAIQKTTLSSDAQAFLPVKLQDGASAEQHHQKAVEGEQQIMQLQRAKEGVDEFFEILKKIKADNNIANLGEDLKEALRKAYTKIQSPLISMTDGADLNARLVQSLSSEVPVDPAILVSDLVRVRPKITEHIALLLTQAQQNKSDALRLENESQQKAPLTVKTADLEKRTLFAMLHDLKLSQSLEKFISGNLQNKLKEHLSPLIWKELSTDGKLDLSKLPYTNLHQDSSDVVLYKQLINSMFYLHKGLKELEQINRDDPSNIITRSRYVFSTMKTLVMAINHSSYYLKEAAKNPGLQAIVQESSDLLEPIRTLPFLSDYLQSTQKIAPVEVEKDVIKLWNDQLQIVKRGLSSVPLPLAKSEKPLKLIAQPKERSYVREMAEALYKIPLAIEHLSSEPSGSLPKPQQQEEQIKAFVERLNGLSFSPESIDKLLAATTKLQKQLNEIGVGSRALVMANLKEIRSEFGFIFMAAAGKAEFELGLKPGTYSSIVRDHFDRFYESLISNMPLEKDQTGLELIIDVTHTKKLLAREKEQLSQAQADTRPELAQKNLFGDDFKSEFTIYNAYRELQELSNTYNDPPNQFEVIDFAEFRTSALALYKTLQPFLVKTQRVFNEQFMENNANDETQLVNALDKVFAARTSIVKPRVALSKLLKLVLDDNFEEKAAQEEFLKAYQELQPYLSKISPSYDLSYFLRELQKPEDFANAAVKIIGERSHLEELVEGVKKTKQSKVSLAQERIVYFDALLKRQIEEIGPQKIEAFKRKVYDNYVNANVESFLALNLGDDQAALFVKHALSDTKRDAMKKAVLMEVTIYDDIELVISQAIDAALPQIVKDNTESFKELIFNNYIEKDIKNKLGDDLGIYKDLFFKKIEPLYRAEQESILKDLVLDKNLSKEIAAQLDSLHGQVIGKNKQLHSDFVNLNRFVEQLKTRISKEQSLEQTPDRREKLLELTGLLSSLDVTKVDRDNPAKNLQQAKIELSLILYNSHLNVIKNQFREQLGDYTELFLKKVNHVYENNKSSIIQKAIKGDNIEDIISAELTTLTLEIEHNARALKAAFMELNTFSKQLNESIRQEQASTNNPCRAKKIELMLKLKEFIHEAPEVQLIDSSWVNNKHKKAQDRLEKIQEYDALIQINDLLISLKENIEKEESTPQTKADRLKAVNALQQTLYDEDIEISVRISTVMEKLREHSQESLLLSSGHNLVTDAFKNYFFTAQIKKEKEKLNSSLGPFKERFMSGVMPDLMNYQKEIKEQMTVGMPEAQIEEIFAKYIPIVFAKHKELQEVCAHLNESLITINKVIATEVSQLNSVTEVELKDNPCHKEKLEMLTVMRDKLHEGAFANDSLKILKDKRQEADKLSASLAQYDQLIELYNLLTAMKTCVLASPDSAIKDKKLESLDSMQKILCRKEPPLDRVKAIEQENKQAYKILATNADGPFMRLYKFFVTLIKNILGKELSQEEKMASKYQDKLGLFKENVESYKGKLDHIKQDEDSSDNSLRSN